MIKSTTRLNFEEKANFDPDPEFREFKTLDTGAIVNGIGRKATDEELIDYLSKDAGPFIDIEEAFAKSQI